MEQFTGKSIFQGIAIGQIRLYTKKQQQVKRYKITDPEAEIARFHKARETAAAELAGLYEMAVRKVGEANAMIFEVHQMMLEDTDYLDSVTHIIRTQEINAEMAVATTGDNFSAMFAAMEDEYMRARAADVKDISERLIACLINGSSAGELLPEPSILVAEDLAPSETVQFDKSMLLAFVTHLGSANSHTAILARTMNLPALIGIEPNPAWNGRLAVVDGYTGTLTIDPDGEYLLQMQARKAQDEEKQRLLQQLKGKETVTKNGRKINLYANVGSLSDIMTAMENDAEGIGLFRSEFLYLEKKEFPTEEEQFSIYRTALENMGGKKVIIRTLDIGADKQIDYFGLEREDNPALGYRAIRICLTRPDIFRTQLRALLRASVYGPLSIMFPMIISLEEVLAIKEILEEVKQELTAQNIPFAPVEIGIMIETPAAVMISGQLAAEVDFFSIGTNDLTQYTLAIDRQNPKLDTFYNPHHPAVLRMIQETVENGHAHGCWVGICGELGADEELTETFLQMGVDELSVSPPLILGLRKRIRELDLEK